MKITQTFKFELEQRFYDACLNIASTHNISLAKANLLYIREMGLRYTDYMDAYFSKPYEIDKKIVGLSLFEITITADDADMALFMMRFWSETTSTYEDEAEILSATIAETRSRISDCLRARGVDVRFGGAV